MSKNYRKSPYKEAGIAIGNMLGTSKAGKIKSFPNPQFESQEEYFEFAIKHRTYGKAAYDLKKQLESKKAT